MDCLNKLGRVKNRLEKIGDTKMAKYECLVCGWVYDEEKGDPDSGVAAGTKWDDLPDDWVCPMCGASKEDFELIE
jgi:rubredoxin-NAD+ reductase